MLWKSAAVSDTRFAACCLKVSSCAVAAAAVGRLSLRSSSGAEPFLFILAGAASSSLVVLRFRSDARAECAPPIALLAESRRHRVLAEPPIGTLVPIFMRAPPIPFFPDVLGLTRKGGADGPQF